jgi:DNA-binding transcriptional MerR regulator
VRSSDGSSDQGGPAAASQVIDLRDAEAARSKPLHGEFSGPEAADLAGITYRQLDYWARRRWVIPSRVSADGVQRRVYTASDVVRLAALGHLGRSRVDVATYGEATGRLQIPNSLAFLVVWGTHDESVVLTSAKDLRQVACHPGRYVIFDPAAVLRELHRRQGEVREYRPRRRTFTGDYKLAVLAEYERLTEPGAKGALLRREGLHTSHLVAWRRSRAAGELVGHPSRTSAAGDARVIPIGPGMATQPA